MTSYTTTAHTTTAATFLKVSKADQKTFFNPPSLKMSEAMQCRGPEAKPRVVSIGEAGTSLDEVKREQEKMQGHCRNSNSDGKPIIILRASHPEPLQVNRQTKLV